MCLRSKFNDLESLHPQISQNQWAITVNIRLNVSEPVRHRKFATNLNSSQVLAIEVQRKLIKPKLTTHFTINRTSRVSEGSTQSLSILCIIRRQFLINLTWQRLLSGAKQLDLQAIDHSPWVEFALALVQFALTLRGFISTMTRAKRIRGTQSNLIYTAGGVRH